MKLLIEVEVTEVAGYADADAVARELLFGCRHSCCRLEADEDDLSTEPSPPFGAQQLIRARYVSAGYPS